MAQIKTSAANRVVVIELTRMFNLGAENIIARIAIAYSLQSGAMMNLLNIEDSGGKEYTYQVLFGQYYSIYQSMICTKYKLHKTNRDIPKYLKMHLDDGLRRIAADVKENPNLVGYDYLFDKIHDGLMML